MTTFFADITINRPSAKDPVSITVEIPACDMSTAVQTLGAWKAGLAVSPRFDGATEEAISAKQRRGTRPMTMLEASRFLRNEVFG